MMVEQAPMVREALTPQEDYLLQRMRWLDKQGEGCYAALDTIRRAVSPEKRTYSLSQARRIVARLRQKRYIVFAGLTASGTNIYLAPDRRYKAEALPVCTSRPTHHLWSTEPAIPLIDAPLPTAPSYLIEGYPICRKLAADYSEDVVRRAVAIIKQTYGPQLQGVKNRTALLRSMCRRILDQRSTKPPEQRRPVTQQADKLRWERQPEEARAAIDALLGRLTSSSPQPAAKPAAAPARPATAAAADTIGACLARWMSGEQAHAKAETRDYYATKAANLRKYIASVTVQELTRDHLADYITARKADGVKLQTIGKEFGLLWQVLRDAGRDLGAEPSFRKLRQRLKPHDERKGRPLSFEDYLALRNMLPEDRRAYLDVGVYTGARKSELERIVREDADLRGGRLHIRGTKTKGSDRWVPLTPEVRQIVLSTKKGELLAPRWPNAHHDLHKACDAAGIERRSTLDLRHTFASWLKSAGVDTFTVAKLLGHSNGKMVEGHYAHLDDRALRQAIAHLPTRAPPGPPQSGTPPAHQTP